MLKNRQQIHNILLPSLMLDARWERWFLDWRPVGSFCYFCYNFFLKPQHRHFASRQHDTGLPKINKRRWWNNFPHSRVLGSYFASNKYDCGPISLLTGVTPLNTTEQYSKGSANAQSWFGWTWPKNFWQCKHCLRKSGISELYVYSHAVPFHYFSRSFFIFHFLSRYIFIFRVFRIFLCWELCRCALCIISCINIYFSTRGHDDDDYDAVPNFFFVIPVPWP